MSTTPAVARQWKLAKNPVAGEKFSSFFALHEVPLTNQDQTPEGQGGKSAKNKVLVKLRYLSNDPSQRTWIGEGKRSYMEPILPGQVMRAWGAGEVIESFKPEFKKGDMVAGQLDWKEYALFEDPPKGGAGLEVLPQGVDPADYLAMGMTVRLLEFAMSLVKKTDIMLSRPLLLTLVFSRLANAHRMIRLSSSLEQPVLLARLRFRLPSTSSRSPTSLVSLAQRRSASSSRTLVAMLR